MAGITPQNPPQQASTPLNLPASNPSSYGGADHSFTLQAIMELQKSCGALTAQVQSLATQIDRMDKNTSDSTGKVDAKIDQLSENIQAVKTKITVNSRVGATLFLLAAAGFGVVWTVSQDAVIEVAKSAISIAITNAAKQESEASQGTPPAPTPN